MKIKDIVFNHINSLNGDINIQALTDEILTKNPNSKWDYTHWNWYRYHITSDKGKFFNLFSEEVRKNIKSLASSRISIMPSVKKLKSKPSDFNHNFKFEDRTMEVEKEIAIILAKTSYHIHPDIVKKIVNENSKFKIEFEKIAHRNLNFRDYFFEGSDCVFPGTRRSINKEKGDKWKNNIYEIDGTILNDNTFPRHLWTFLCCNKMYSSPSWIESGLNSFELAHIFSHKIEERAFDISCFDNVNIDIKPYSLFTSASNTVIIPKGLTKPTDKSPIIKIVYFKRHLDLYGHIIQLPYLKCFKEELVPEWYDEIIWNEPFLPEDWEERINNLLNYRKGGLISKYNSKIKAAKGFSEGTETIIEGKATDISESTEAIKSYQELVNNNEIKIGKTAFQFFTKLAEEGKLNKLYDDYPDRKINSFNILKRVTNDDIINPRIEKGVSRYYSKVFVDNGTYYLLCSQWYNKNISILKDIIKGLSLI